MSRLLWSSLASLLLSSADAAPCAPGSDPASCDLGEGVGALGLLQMESHKHRLPAVGGIAGAEARAGGLVLQHVPYNFGHTVEKVAAFGSGKAAMFRYMSVEAAIDTPMTDAARWHLVDGSKRDGAEVWGHSNPDLFESSTTTGCPLYFTPGKYWPTELAQSYFGNKTIFGMLRDPYERLVAMFRGNFGAYGGSYPEFFKTCDVNGAVRKMMTDFLAGDIYGGACCFLPQAEYFDGPFGITLAVDNRRFPDSMNDVFAENGYTHMHIETEDILHVNGCPDSWSGDLDCETKKLVRKVYSRDFELLCEKFGYCDPDENCCIAGVPNMCPSNMTAKLETATRCV